MITALIIIYNFLKWVADIFVCDLPIPQKSNGEYSLYMDLHHKNI